jgi:predicted DNA-binding protein (MmcQ/YjbR family)
MNIEEIRNYCLLLPATSESFPFDETTLVFKVSGKIFALVNLDTEQSINLKCNPEKAIELREQYPCVLPGYHMNKIHWNTVLLDGSINDNLLKEWIEHSFWLVVSQLPKITKMRINSAALK